MMIWTILWFLSVYQASDLGGVDANLQRISDSNPNNIYRKFLFGLHVKGGMYDNKPYRSTPEISEVTTASLTIGKNEDSITESFVSGSTASIEEIFQIMTTENTQGSSNNDEINAEGLYKGSKNSKSGGNITREHIFGRRVKKHKVGKVHTEGGRLSMSDVVKQSSFVTKPGSTGVAENAATGGTTITANGYRDIVSGEISTSEGSRGTTVGSILTDSESEAMVFSTEGVIWESEASAVNEVMERLTTESFASISNTINGEIFQVTTTENTRGSSEKNGTYSEDLYKGSKYSRSDGNVSTRGEKFGIRINKHKLGKVHTETRRSSMSDFVKQSSFVTNPGNSGVVEKGTAGSTKKEANGARDKVGRERWTSDGSRGTTVGSLETDSGSEAIIFSREAAVWELIASAVSEAREVRGVTDVPGWTSITSRGISGVSTGASVGSGGISERLAEGVGGVDGDFVSGNAAIDGGAGEEGNASVKGTGVKEDNKSASGAADKESRQVSVDEVRGSDEMGAEGKDSNKMSGPSESEDDISANGGIVKGNDGDGGTSRDARGEGTVSREQSVGSEEAFDGVGGIVGSGQEVDDKGIRQSTGSRVRVSANGGAGEAAGSEKEEYDKEIRQVIINGIKGTANGGDRKETKAKVGIAVGGKGKTDGSGGEKAGYGGVTNDSGGTVIFTRDAARRSEEGATRTGRASGGSVETAPGSGDLADHTDEIKAIKGKSTAHVEVGSSSGLGWSAGGKLGFGLGFGASLGLGIPAILGPGIIGGIVNEFVVNAFGSDGKNSG